MSLTPSQHSSAAQVLNDRNIHVVKIGGDNAAQLKENADNIQGRAEIVKKQVLVLSAIRSSNSTYNQFAEPTVVDRSADGSVKNGFNTTSHLIALAKALQRGDKEHARGLLRRIVEFTKTILTENLKGTDDSHILMGLYYAIDENFSQKVEKIIQTATNHTIENHGEDWQMCTATSVQTITGLGEELARDIYTLYLRNKNIQVGKFEQESQLGVEQLKNQGVMESLRETMRGKMAALLEEHSIIVAGGYLPHTGSKRGYSDHTAAELAVVADTSGNTVLVVEKQDAIRSGDPRKFPSTKLIRAMTYFLAQELFGSTRGANAAALHPEAVGLLQHHHIPIIVCNPKKPDDATLIGDTHPKPNGIEIVSVRDVPLAIEIRDPTMISETGFIERIGEFFREQGISIDQMATSEGSVTITFTKDVDDKILAEFGGNLEGEIPSNIIVRRKLAAIFCLGNNMKRPGVMAEVALALRAANVDIHIATQGQNESVMTFIVDSASADIAAKSIHDFCVLLSKEQRDEIMGAATTLMQKVSGMHR